MASCKSQKKKKQSNYTLEHTPLDFIVSVKVQHETGQLLGLQRRYGIVERGAYATNRAMPFQLDHTLSLGLGQELLLQGIVASGTANSEGYIHARAHIRIYGTIEEAIGHFDGLVDDLGLGRRQLGHASNSAMPLDPFKDQTHHIDTGNGIR